MSLCLNHLWLWAFSQRDEKKWSACTFLQARWPEATLVLHTGHPGQSHESHQKSAAEKWGESQSLWEGNLSSSYHLLLKQGLVLLTLCSRWNCRNHPHEHVWELRKNSCCIQHILILSICPNIWFIHEQCMNGWWPIRAPAGTTGLTTASRRTIRRNSSADSVQTEHDLCCISLIDGI